MTPKINIDAYIKKSRRTKKYLKPETVNLAEPPEGMELYGVVYFNDDGGVNSASHLFAPDYWGACERAFKQSRDKEFQIVVQDDCATPLHAADTLILVAAAKHHCAVTTLARPLYA
ncbi:hypothetical protein ABID16_001028 [Rhizobium aquaticum]|uniref:Uncharacterized protein n=1 Tax=Rhizobium aquaticum TaxID=1549636 RepID=A0ABV2IWJ4_9HYPH